MHEKSIPDEVIERLVTTWYATPAFAVDRYLDVRAANTQASEMLGLRRGVNVARVLYLEPHKVPGGASDLTLRQAVAGSLREAVERYGPDTRFESVLGELLALSPSFASDFAQWSASLPLGQVRCSAVGGRPFDFYVFDAPRSAELRLVVLRAASGITNRPSGPHGGSASADAGTKS